MEGIIRDEKGIWISGFHITNCNAIKAECWGILERLKLTKSLGLKILEMNVDSKEVVKAIKEGTIIKLSVSP